MKLFNVKMLGRRLFEIPLLFLCLAFSSQLAAQAVTGKVTDAATGEALVGVTVAQSGARNGGITDIDGNFRLTVADANGAIVVSYTG